ncbi:FAD-dependent oxidoreductase [Kibdelosporangium aridum]|uniref:FAD-dependent oxidoreductase n=1 Tax=Kibdelosporangium aridum TaxID=2030 RepID=UPI000A8F0BBA
MPVSPVRLFAEIGTRAVPQVTPVLMKRAVVLGASMGGLLAARVLSDYAEEVLLIERDVDVPGPQSRPGVPQGSQLHALLPAGAVQLERWFPGFCEEAIAAGVVAPPTDGSKNRVFRNGRSRPIVPIELEVPLLMGTRSFLESLVRARTLKLKNVRQVPGHADGLVLDGARVTGARYVPAEAPDVVSESADLVVDAMGRSSRLGNWLEDNGWPRPPMRRMPIKLNYATALFEYDESITGVWSSVALNDADAKTGRAARLGGFNLVEGNRLIMLIAGYGDDRPSRDPRDFTARCRTDFPTIYGDIAEHATMLGDVMTYHQADSRRRDFHLVDRFPAGLIATGDAIASFNPVYGQGMTSALLHASCLAQYLWSQPALDKPAEEYFDRVRVVVDAAWQISTFADLELPHIAGPRPRGYRSMKWISDQLFMASESDEVLNRRLTYVTTMLAHPRSLMDVNTVFRTLRFAVLGREKRQGS